MWTPKRIILLAGGFAAFTLVYLLYSLTALGRINTLPPLPDKYKPSDDGNSSAVVHTPKIVKPTPLERKLEMAFSRGCKELDWPVLLELNSKSMVLAAGRFEIVEDGRMLLEPMSLALFGKKKDDGRDIEINTLKCNQAYITFDRPISSFNEMNGRKIIKAELFGDTKPIRLTNNRRTAVRDDDLVVTIRNGPLYYIEKSQIVITSDYVKISDGDFTSQDGRLIRPKAVIIARGLEMNLATSSPPRQGLFSAAKPKSETITGVKRIVLKQDVDMHLTVASGTPFPGDKKTPGKEGQQPAARPDDQPSLVHILTPGRFTYWLFKDHDEALFELPADADQANSPQDVIVERINEQTGKNDMLVCERLELRLKRRDNEAPPPKSGRRDAAATGRRGAVSEQGIEIETAHATGPFVTLTSDAEKLDAHGTDFFHDAGKKLTILKGKPYMEATKEESLIQAPELNLQDVPVPVRETDDKKANLPPKTYQQIQAAGPGSIHMIDKSTGRRTVHAYWKDKLVSTRDGDMDLLILRGNARFVDDEHDQALKAETLKVWLLADDKEPSAKAVAKAEPAKASKPASTAKASATPGQGRRPHRIEARRNVLAHSPDLNIHDTARLVVDFTDVPPERMPPPSGGDKPGTPSLGKKTAAAPPATPSKPRSSGSGAKNRSRTPKETEPRPSGSGVKNHSLTAAAPTESGPQPSGSGAKNRSRTVAAPDRRPTQTRQATNPNPPIDLSARSIEAKVLRCQERMALDHLWAEGGALDALDRRGGVVVRQEPSKPGDEGVYIEGNTLDMTSTANGHKLHVTGDLARLKMDKIFLLGPEVNIDQVANKAWIDGEGAMQMQSTTTLEGKPLAHPVPLTVHWSRSMVFFGAFAEFYGSIQAEQENARLACQHLQVMFDRPISLKKGMGGDQPAKVSKLVGDKGANDQLVRVEDRTFARDSGQLQKYQLLMGSAVVMTTVPRDDDLPLSPGGAEKDKGKGKSKDAKKDKEEGKSKDANEVTLSGPGSVRVMQRGDANLTRSPGKPAAKQSTPPKSAAQEMKLTYIQFENLMKASSRTNVASFWGAVRVLNLPCKDPHRPIDLDAMLATELPADAMYLRCNRLKVGTYQRNGRTYQEMDARGQVYVKGRDFTAQCDHMTFNEEKDQVIFYGEGDNEAVMAQYSVKGVPPKVLRGKKIKYYRTTGRFTGSDIRSFDG